jgi:hypothetical protein
MGYSCPVCSDPQADDIHLANHLAFTAIARGGDHEMWLGEHVPGWGQMDDETLAGELVERAEETEYPQVFENTTGTDHQHGDTSADHAHRTPNNTVDLPDGATRVPDAELDEDTDDVLEQARELTRQRREDDDTDE